MYAFRWETITKLKLSGWVDLKKHDVMNKARTMKLGWKVINNSDDLWCNVMRSTYKHGYIHELTKYRGPNLALWKEILKFVPHIMSVGLWSLRDGRNTKVWSDNWLEPGISINCYHFQMPYDFGGGMVSYLIDENDEWNWRMMHDCMPE